MGWRGLGEYRYLREKFYNVEGVFLSASKWNIKKNETREGGKRCENCGMAIFFCIFACLGGGGQTFLVRGRCRSPPCCTI